MKKAFVLFLFSILFTAAFAQNAKDLTISFPCVGNWKVTGRDTSNWMGKLVIEEINGSEFYGFFEWHYSPNNELVGNEYFKGEYNSESNTVVIQGYRVTDTTRLGIGEYEARLSKDSLNFESGTWTDGGVWEAVFEAQQQKVEAAALFQSNLTNVLGPSRAEISAKRLTEISANISAGSTGTDARSEVAFRRRWNERLTNTEELFNAIFSSHGLPYTLFYSSGIQQGKINYQTETIELSTTINLRMNNDWINILDITLQTIKKIDDELQGTGKRSEWGLNDWPNAGVTQVNPFRNRFTGGGYDGTTRHGTQWKTDFSIVFEVLNNNNRVIGRRSVDLSPFFEFYCSNRDFYGNFIGYGGRVSHITFGDPGRAIRLQYEINNIKTITFSNVKINETSDAMTIRVASVNGNRPENTGVKVTPLSDSQWKANDWEEK